MIDDDAQAVSLVKAILKPYNVRVSSVDNARAGIEQALRNKPDLVILDLVMPGVDGFEVIAALRRDKDMSRVPILVHTAKTLTPEDALGLYERNWRQVDTAALDASERALVNALVQHLGGGRLLV